MGEIKPKGKKETKGEKETKRLVFDEIKEEKEKNNEENKQTDCHDRIN